MTNHGFRTLVTAAFAVLILTAVPLAAFAGTRTWTGTNSGTWSDAGNWSGGAPQAGDDLVFPAAASNKSNTNDLAAGTAFNSITFTGDGYTLSGNSVALGAGGIVTTVSSNASNVVALALDVSASRPVFFNGTWGAVLDLRGSIGGTGGLSISGAGNFQSTVLISGVNTYSGGTTMQNIFVSVGNNAAFGTGTVTNVDATINMYGFTVANALVVQGFGIGGNAAVNTSGTWSGPVTLTGNTGLGSLSTAGLVFSGAISGGFDITGPVNHDTSIVVLSGTSPAFSGALHIGSGALFVNGVVANASANLNGASGAALLGGTGTIGGAVAIPSGKHLGPGFNGPGILNVGNLSLAAGSRYDVQLQGTTAGVGYDQANVTGTVTLGGILTATLGFAPLVGTQFTIINNDGADAVSGTFAGLPEGAEFVGVGGKFRISYVGGTGNDVTLTVGSGQSVNDFDADFKTDRTVFRPSTGTWYSALSSGGATSTNWGVSTDVDAAGDYDGDGKSDVAVWRPSSGLWYVVYSSDQSIHTETWGINGDIPLAGDVDGDAHADFVIFRPSAGAWFVKTSAGPTTATIWGVTGDQPLLADFDFDGKLDIVIYRPTTGVWYVSKSSGGTTIIAWGTTNDVPVVGDWDGDGKSDAAVFRPSTGQWWINRSTGGTLTTAWGISGDTPVSGDWDNDGKSDFAVWRPSSGVWYIQLSNGGTSSVGWGVNGDKAIGRVPGS